MSFGFCNLCNLGTHPSLSISPHFGPQHPTACANEHQSEPRSWATSLSEESLMSRAFAA